MNLLLLSLALLGCLSTPVLSAFGPVKGVCGWWGCTKLTGKREIATEAAEEPADVIVEKREAEVVEKRETDEGVNENGEVEAVEKREASEKRCGNIRECRCDERGCNYVNGCLIRKVDHCPPLFGKKCEVDGILEKKAEVLEKRQICLTITGCLCKADGTCWYTERCKEPVKVTGKREIATEAAEEPADVIVEKREAEVVEKRETDEGVNENGEVEAVEKREASEKRCGNIRECRCDERGCNYVNGCLIRKVDHCPPLFGKKCEVDGILEKKAEVLEKRQICLTITGCLCKADGTCWYTERCKEPVKVGYCPQNGNKREAAEEIVEKREAEVVEKRETDEGVNENGEVEAVEKREASETRCKTSKPSCECTNGHGCFYTNGCLRWKVPHCPWDGKGHEAVKGTRQR